MIFVGLVMSSYGTFVGPVIWYFCWTCHMVLLLDMSYDTFVGLVMSYVCHVIYAA
jgi:hypothetical protein